MDISEIFAQVSTQMRSDFELALAAMNHPGLKGGAFEPTFREFLRKYLPAALDISTGLIIDMRAEGIAQPLAGFRSRCEN